MICTFLVEKEISELQIAMKCVKIKSNDGNELKFLFKLKMSRFTCRTPFQTSRKKYLFKHQCFQISLFSGNEINTDDSY